jgi:hypothetical protein
MKTGNGSGWGELRKRQLRRTTEMRRAAKLGCVALAALMISGCGAVSANEIGENDYDVSGTYRMEVASGDADATVFSYNFSGEDMTFTETLTIGENAYELASGSYEVSTEDDLVQTVSDSDVEQDFVIFGEYLLADGFFYEGDIPDGTTFDMKCIYTGEAGNTSTVEFHKDGSYTFTGSIKSTGTYQRNGSVIEVTPEDGSSLVDFIIYNGKITNSYYKKLDA